MRLFARLVETESGTHLWAERYDAPADDLFAVQDWIAEQVAGLIESELMQAETSRARRKPPAESSTPTTSISRLSRWSVRLRSRRPDLLCRFWKRSRRSIRTMPPLTRFWPGRMRSASSTPVLKENSGIGARPSRMRRAAIEHASDDPTALALGGFVLALLGVDKRDIARFPRLHVRRRSNPASATVACLGAHANAVSGRVGATGVYAARALDLSPSHPLAFLAHLGLGARATSEGRWDDGAACTARAIQLKSGLRDRLSAVRDRPCARRPRGRGRLSSSAGPRT